VRRGYAGLVLVLVAVAAGAAEMPPVNRYLALASNAMAHGNPAQRQTGPTGKGWVRNAFTIDEQGGIYIASRDHMHKVVWTGGNLSTDPATREQLEAL